METEELQSEETLQEAAEETTQDSAPGAEEKTEEQETTPEEKEKEDPQKGVQGRINELTWKYREEERKRQRLEQELEEERKKQAAPQPSSPDSKPTLEDFDHDEAKFLEALTDWKVNNALRDKEEKAAEIKRKADEKSRMDAITDHAISTINTGRTKYEDYDQVIGAINNILDYDMGESLMDVEDAAAVTYYLGKNPEEADAIAQMTPTRRAVALGKIEAKIGNTKGKIVSDAPPPVRPVGGKSTIDTGPPKDGDEYRAWRKRQREGT